jgi:hypothetical protein
MTLRTKPRIRDRLLRLAFLRRGRRWLLLGVLCATASAVSQPTSPPAAPPPSAAPVAKPAATAGQSTVPADEGFLEFLGSDDVGDAAWWEFLKRAPPRGSDPPAPPPQDAKK